MSTAPRWDLHHDSCFAEGALPALEAKSVDVIITDPPYSPHVHSKSRAGARKVPLKNGAGRLPHSAISREVDFGFDEMTPQEMLRAAEQFARLAKRWVLVFCDVELSGAWRRALELHGLEYVRTCAWIKEGCTPQFTGDRPAAGFEAIVCAHPKGRKRWNGGGRRGVFSHPIVLDRGSGQTLHGRGSNGVRLHPTQKPVPLMLELVSLFSDQDELVCDPYAGSGTTGVACLRTERRFLGWEVNETHAKNAQERLRAEAHGLELSAARAGQVPLF